MSALTKLQTFIVNLLKSQPELSYNKKFIEKCFTKNKDNDVGWFLDNISKHRKGKSANEILEDLKVLDIEASKANKKFIAKNFTFSEIGIIKDEKSFEKALDKKIASLTAKLDKKVKDYKALVKRVSDEHHIFNYEYSFVTKEQLKHMSIEDKKKTIEQYQKELEKYKNKETFFKHFNQYIARRAISPSLEIYAGDVWIEWGHDNYLDEQATYENVKSASDKINKYFKNKKDWVYTLKERDPLASGNKALATQTSKWMGDNEIEGVSIKRAVQPTYKKTWSERWRDWRNKRKARKEERRIKRNGRDMEKARNKYVKKSRKEHKKQKMTDYNFWK